MAKSPWLSRIHCRHCRARIVPVRLVDEGDDGRIHDNDLTIWVHSTALDQLCKRPPNQLTLDDPTDYTKQATPL